MSAVSKATEPEPRAKTLAGIKCLRCRCLTLLPEGCSRCGYGSQSELCPTGSHGLGSECSRCAEVGECAECGAEEEVRLLAYQDSLCPRCFDAVCAREGAEEARYDARREFG